MRWNVGLSTPVFLGTAHSPSVHTLPLRLFRAVWRCSCQVTWRHLSTHYWLKAHLPTNIVICRPHVFSTAIPHPIRSWLLSKLSVATYSIIRAYFFSFLSGSSLLFPSQMGFSNWSNAYGESWGPPQVRKTLCVGFHLLISSISLQIQHFLASWFDSRLSKQIQVFVRLSCWRIFLLSCSQFTSISFLFSGVILFSHYHDLAPEVQVCSLP